MSWPRFVNHWGSTVQEQAREFPCDALLAEPNCVMHRACDVDAPADIAFRWMCQMRVAPYSYDLIDNRGKRSPRELIDGLDDLEIGQSFMIFTLASFVPGRSVTLTSQSKAFGLIAATYEVLATGERTSRYVVRIALTYPRSRYGRFLRLVLPPGDLVMMRKQLLTWAKFAKQTDQTDQRLRAKATL